MRELRSLTSFINAIKTADLSRPGLTLDEFNKWAEPLKDNFVGKELANQPNYET